MVTITKHRPNNGGMSLEMYGEKDSVWPAFIDGLDRLNKNRKYIIERVEAAGNVHYYLTNRRTKKLYTEFQIEGLLEQDNGK
jgi:hypothetical protein